MNYYTFTTQDSVADIRYIAFAKSLVDYAVIDLTGSSILAYEFNKPITIKRHYTEGTINSSHLERDQGKRGRPVAGDQDLGCVCLADRLLRREGRRLVPGTV